MNSEEFISKIVNPELIEYWMADYVLVNIFKAEYVQDAIENNTRALNQIQLMLMNSQPTKKSKS